LDFSRRFVKAINADELPTSRVSQFFPQGAFRMSKIYQYFNIPFDLVPKDQTLPYTVWFATWSTKPPILEPGMAPPVVMGVTENELPAGAVALGTASKDPPPPPPPLASGGISEYKTSISQWLELTRDADE